MQWLVDWLGDQGKKGVCIGKKVHCGPVLVGEPKFYSWGRYTMVLTIDL